MLANWKTVLAGMMMVAMTTTTFYLITVYTPTFGKTVLHLSTSDSLIVTLLRRRVELHLAADRRGAVGPHRTQAAACSSSR